MAADGRGRLWKHLSGLLPEDAHATRIENSVSAGFPDVHVTYRERSCTIELKVASKLPLGKKGLRKSQIDWINAEIEAGGQVWVVIQFGKRVFAVSGTSADLINDLDEYALETRSYAVWPIREGDPDTIYSLLMS